MCNSQRKQNCSFFEQFSEQEIFSLWNSSQTLLELAQKLGFQNTELSRIDYEYIDSKKTREVWKKYILGKDRLRELSRSKEIESLSFEPLQNLLESSGIETLSHVALHYLLSSKHGRKQIKQQIFKLGIDVKSHLHKGVYGYSKAPLQWPTRFFGKQNTKKPMICPLCNFEAIVSHQIELHHAGDIYHGPKIQRNKSYYTHTDIHPMCANCHSLQHRSGEHLQALCGKWHGTKLRGIQKYKNPGDIFSENCSKTYRL